MVIEGETSSQDFAEGIATEGNTRDMGSVCVVPVSSDIFDQRF